MKLDTQPIPYQILVKQEIQVFPDHVKILEFHKIPKFVFENSIKLLKLLSNTNESIDVSLCSESGNITLKAHIVDNALVVEDFIFKFENITDILRIMNPPIPRNPPNCGSSVQNFDPTGKSVFGKI